MSNQRILLHLDRRWYEALSSQLEKMDTTVEDELDSCLDAMIDQLPERVRERISQEIWEEDQRWREAEAAHRFSVLRVTQDGRTDHLLAEGAASADVLRIALCLRAYLLRKGNSTEGFAGSLGETFDIAPEVFQEHADALRHGSERLMAALDIDLDHGEFSMLDAADGWETYAVRDVSTAAWHASRKDGLDWERRLNIFAGHLETRMIRSEGPQVEPPAGPTM